MLTVLTVAIGWTAARDVMILQCLCDGPPVPQLVASSLEQEGTELLDITDHESTESLWARAGKPHVIGSYSSQQGTHKSYLAEG